MQKICQFADIANFSVLFLFVFPLIFLLVVQSIFQDFMCLLFSDEGGKYFSPACCLLCFTAFLARATEGTSLGLTLSVR